MDIIVYIFMFTIGIVLGSFYTLAVYRIPLKQDITHTRSYCPKCNHRLEFLDLIVIVVFISSLFPSSLGDFAVINNELNFTCEYS